MLFVGWYLTKCYRNRWVSTGNKGRESTDNCIESFQDNCFQVCGWLAKNNVLQILKFCLKNGWLCWLEETHLERTICRKWKELSYCNALSGYTKKWKFRPNRRNESTPNKSHACHSDILRVLELSRLQQLNTVFLTEGCANKMLSYM